MTSTTEGYLNAYSNVAVFRAELVDRIVDLFSPTTYDHKLFLRVSGMVDSFLQENPVIALSN